MENPTPQNKYYKYIKFAVFCLVLISVVVIIYFTFFKRPSKGPDIGDNCNYGYVYDKTLSKCIPSCSDGSEWNSVVKKCVPKCTSPSKLNPKSLKCQKWPVDTCGIKVDPATGVVSGTLASNDGFDCLGQGNWFDLSDAQEKLNSLCTTTTCMCGNSDCFYPECKDGTIKFNKYSKKNGACVIKRECGKIPSDFAKLFPGAGFGCSLYKKIDPADQSICIDLTLDDLSQACSNDKDGCKYPYIYDPTTKKCGNVTPGMSGCRPVGTDSRFNGIVCGNFTVNYTIAVDVSTVTTTDIKGQLAFTTEPKPIPSKWRYILFATNQKGVINSAGEMIFGDIAKVIHSDKPTIKNCSYYQDFEIKLDPPHVVLKKGDGYRLLIYGYDVVNGEETPKYCSMSALNNKEVVDNATMGSLIIVTEDDSPTPDKLSTQPQLNRQASDDYATGSGKQVINNLLSKGNSVKPQDNSIPVPTLDSNLFPYSLCTCTPELCVSSEGVSNMIIIIKWDAVTNFKTFNPNRDVVKYCVIKNRSDKVGGTTIVADNTTDTVFVDFLPVGTTWVYQIGSYVSTKTDVNSTYKTAKLSSALRYLIVDIPIYTKKICQSIPLDTDTPPFYLLDNTKGMCSHPNNFGDKAKDWWCSLGQSKNEIGFPSDKNINISLWSSTSNKCEQVMPNNYPTLTNNGSIKSEFGQGSDLWFTGEQVEQNAQCGCIPNGDGTSRCPQHPDDVAFLNWSSPQNISYKDVLNRLKSIDSFGQAEIDGYKTNDTSIMSQLQQLYDPNSCKISTPLWGTTESKCEHDDVACQHASSLTDCNNNYCSEWTPAGGIPGSYTRTVKYIPPDNANSFRLACNGKGTFSVTGRGTLTIQGSCTCTDPQNHDPHCVERPKSPWELLPNCEEITDGKCSKCIWEIPTRSNPNTINRPNPLDTSMQPFTLIGDGSKGCAVNKDPWVWSSIVGGYSAHNGNDGGDWNWCSDDFDNQVLRGTGGAGKFNSCGLTKEQIAEKKKDLKCPARKFYNAEYKPGNNGTASCDTFCKNTGNDGSWGKKYNYCQYGYTTNDGGYHTCDYNPGNGNPMTCACSDRDESKTTQVDFNFSKVNTDYGLGGCGTDCVLDAISGPMIQRSGTGIIYQHGSSYTDAILTSPETTQYGVGFKEAVKNMTGNDEFGYGAVGGVVPNGFVGSSPLTNVPSSDRPSYKSFTGCA
jgi:hypothetical protein